MIGCIRVAILTAALVFFLKLSDVGAAAVTVPSLAGFGGTGIERGTVRVVCELNSQLSVRVRAVVLDVGEPAPKHDVLLAPAHGFPQDSSRIKKNCRIFGTRGPPGRIAEFWLSDSRNTSMGQDWVVLMTRSALSGSVGRLRAGVISQSSLERLAADEKAVAVMLSSSVADQRDCRILELLEPRVFSHSCPGWAGLSGAPIVIALDSEPVVIGFDIASAMRPQESRGPLFLGVGLVINDTVVEAIRQAAELARD
jgi:hypothetical protein